MIMLKQITETITTDNFFKNQSDGWTTDDLIYHWKKEDPVQITDDLNLPR